jgi:hypothetical protein
MDGLASCTRSAIGAEDSAFASKKVANSVSSSADSSSEPFDQDISPKKA